MPVSFVEIGREKDTNGDSARDEGADRNSSPCSCSRSAGYDWERLGMKGGDCGAAGDARLLAGGVGSLAGTCGGESERRVEESEGAS